MPQRKWLRATLRAGDALILPKYWLHWVISAPWSIMVNKWLDTRAAIIALRCYPDCNGLLLANVTESDALLELSNSFSALSGAGSDVSAHTRSRLAPPLSHAVGLAGVLESTFVVMPGVHSMLRDANITFSPPPPAVWSAVSLLLPSVRQVACLINRSLCLWSVTFVYMSAGVSRRPHVDPGSYELIISVTVGGEGLAQFTTPGGQPLTSNLRASAGDVVAFTGFARWEARHSFINTSTSPRLSIVFRFGSSSDHTTRR